MAKHMTGEKLGKHTTIIDAAVDMAKLADRRPEVTRVILGAIAQGGSGRARAHFREIPAGWLVKVSGSRAVQTFIICTKNPAATKAALEQCFA